MNSPGRNPEKKPRDPDFVGADAAMHRAAKRARKRAKETAEMATANKARAGSGDAPGGLKRKPGEIHGMHTKRDPRERGPRKTG
ncbi:MAG: hypothetical protein OXG62_02575 [Nitrospinae bacterium]|nr:hypothetical protein [Nitrospinota bacterium]